MNLRIETDSSAVLSPLQAARYLGVAQATLSKMRCWGGGPEYLKLGRKVVYDRGALDAWRNERRARNTSDAARLPRRMAEEPCDEAR
jgi:Helix-turn-helix domain